MSTSYGSMIVNSVDMGVGWQLTHTGEHEPEVVDFGLKIIDRCRRDNGEGVQVIDVGSNIGTCVLPWGKHMNGWGALIGYEPQERIYYALAGNVALNNLMNVSVKLGAVGEHTSTMKIPQTRHDIRANYGGYSVNMTNANKIQPDISLDPKDLLKTNVYSLDDEGYVRVDLIKIDVEGYEPQVFDGARKLIDDFKPIIIAEFGHCGQDALVSRLKDYEYFGLGGNLVFVHRSKEDMVRFVRHHTGG
jgi:FkbM family methyltransferase